MTTQDSKDTTAATPSGSDSAALSRLHASIAQVRDQLARRAQANRTRQNLVLGIGGAFVALVAIGMSAVTRLTTQLDADALAQIGRIEVQKRLPDARAALEQHLKSESPRLVGDALRSILTLMPRLRVLLMHDVNERLDSINAEFKSQTLAHMTDVIHNTKEQLDKEWPNLNDAAKLEKLVEAVAADYRTNVAALTDELYPSYQEEMSRITGFLTDLAHKKPEELSREDRMRREVIEILLQLIVRHRAPSDAEFLSGEVATPAFLKQALENLTHNTSKTPDYEPEGETVQTDGEAGDPESPGTTPRPSSKPAAKTTAKTSASNRLTNQARPATSAKPSSPTPAK